MCKKTTKKARDGIRTRDPRLGKAILHHWATRAHDMYLQNYTQTIFSNCKSYWLKPVISIRLSTLGQAFDRLVTVNSTHRCASIPALSTSSSLRGLSLFRVWISHLEGGFTLRCLQRLSLPVLATRPCHWHDNRSTSGRSIPVLSY